MKSTITKTSRGSTGTDRLSPPPTFSKFRERGVNRLTNNNILSSAWILTQHTRRTAGSKYRRYKPLVATKYRQADEKRKVSRQTQRIF
jgi:hypothetical protein